MYLTSSFNIKWYTFQPLNLVHFSAVDNNRQLRGLDLLSKKTAAIDCCAFYDLAVILVPTLVPGVNTDQIGQIIEFALGYMPTVRGVHFQPISYFGRYPRPPANTDRLTIPEIIQAIETQTGGLVRVEQFKPPGCENAWCSFHGNFVLMPNGELVAWTQHQPHNCCCQPESAAEGAAQARRFVRKHWSGLAADVIPLMAADTGPGLGGWDELLTRARTHTFSISGMAFQDAWNLDLERLRDCCIHTVSPDGRIIPFCAYNLTNRQGEALYRRPAR